MLRLLNYRYCNAAEKNNIELCLKDKRIYLYICNLCKNCKILF